MNTKKLKQLFVLMLAGCVLLGSTACGSSSSSDDSSDSSSETTETSDDSSESSDSSSETADLEEGEYSGFILDYGKYSDIDWDEYPSYKIGFSWSASTDVLGSMYERSVAYACDVFHCEFQFVEWDTSSTTFAADAIENLCQAGCDGIVDGYVDSGSVEIMQKYGVYYVGCLNQMSDELLAMAATDEYFCGNVIDDDYLSCYESVVALYEAGCRNILWTAGTPGNTQADIRASGFEDACALYDDLNVVTTIRSGVTNSEVIDDIESALAAYPDLDGIAMGNGVDITSMIYATGADSRVKVASTDLCTSYAELFYDDIMVYCATDQYPTECIAFTLLYNALSGNAVLEDVTEQVYRNFLVIETYDEFMDMYDMSFVNIFPYTAEQLIDLVVIFNEDAGQELYDQYCEEYTIENIQETNEEYLDLVPEDERAENLM